MPSKAYPEIFLLFGWLTSPPEGSLVSGCLWKKDLELLLQTWLPKNHQTSPTNARLGHQNWEVEDCETVWGFLSAKDI